MQRRDETLKRAEEFVRDALAHMSKGRVKESTVKSVAKKVSKAIALPRKQQDEKTRIHI
jgi:hypothetical protein